MVKLAAADDRDRPDMFPTVTPLFAGLDGAAVADVLACARTRRYEVGQLICREGEESDCVLVLERGLAEAFVPSVTDSCAISVGCLHPGDLVGEIGVVTDRPCSASVIARSEVRAVEITRDDFLRLLARHPRLQVHYEVDIPVTPQFGPGTWRDMRLGPLFLAAGVEATEAHLTRLGALARPGRVPA